MSTHDVDMPSRALAEYVRACRARKGLSVVEAAKLAGISRSKWTEIEAGQTPLPKENTLGRVARVIEVDFEEIMRLTAVPTKAPRPPSESVWEAVQLVRDELRELRDEVAELRDEVRGSPPPSGPAPPAPPAKKRPPRS